MTRTLLFAAAMHLILAGCTTTQAPEYQLGVHGTRHTKSDAERFHAGQAPQQSAKADFDTPPRVLSSRFPDYPRELIRAEISGTVIVRFTVEADGSVGDAAVQGSPPPQLAAIALDAIKLWKFTPATKQGLPVRTRLAQPFVFQVE